MAYREFTDEKGNQWQAWEVVPSSAERRSPAERRFGVRQGRERRREQQFRVPMEEGMAQGWLAFESPAEKRRLHPIPAGWQDLSDAELIALCRSAELAPRTIPRPAE